MSVIVASSSMLARSRFARATIAMTLALGCSASAGDGLGGSDASVDSPGVVLRDGGADAADADANADGTVSVASGDADAYCANGVAKGGIDNGVQLPTRCYATASAGTPSHGKTWAIAKRADWDAALTGLACGDELVIKAGTVLDFANPTTLPSKNCADGAYITIRSSGTTDQAFPKEGTRLTPCFAGMATYPGRDAYPCSGSPTNLLATLRATDFTTGATPLVVNGDHYRLEGLEITRVNTPGHLTSLVTIVDAATSHHVIIDRCWIHGTEVGSAGGLPQTGIGTETIRGVELGQSNTIAIIDSYVSDIYSISGINGQNDAQAISGATGKAALSPWGNWKVYNNHLEGGSETGFLFGGGGGPPKPSSGFDIPFDIEIRHNEMFRPLSWQPPSIPTPGYPPGKNGFEFKNGGRVLVEGNYIKNVWYDAQVGQAFLIAPKNQPNKLNVGNCPSCAVVDITVRDNKFYNVASGIAIFNSEPNGGVCPTCVPLGLFRASVHDNLIDYIHLPVGTGVDDLELTTVSDPSATFDGLTFAHNTFAGGRRSAIEMGGPLAGMQNIVIRDNIFFNGTTGLSYTMMLNTGCSNGLGSASKNVKSYFDACFAKYTFVANAIVGGSGTVGHWPTDGNGLANFFPTDGASVGFVNYAQDPKDPTTGSGGDYHLQSSSPYRSKGSDGADVGANIDAVQGFMNDQY